MRRAAALLAFAMISFASIAARAELPARRFALVVGADDGGPERLRLRYAASDARAFAEVLTQLGGVSPADLVTLTQPSKGEVLAGLDALAVRLRAAKSGAGRLEAVLYYSGHSDEEGLLLQGEKLGYVELRHALESLPADVKVAILDSCASGALTRVKGGAPRPPFLADASSQVKGHAFLTSSAADEAAQESDRIGGSYFTHALLSGLRGAADTSRTGKVTLTEAYQFAFAETLARTEKSQSGPQHPAYDIQLVGTGDLVMTDLRGTSAGLVLPAALSGRVYVRDAEERLLVELRKEPGRVVELGLAAGDYRVVVEEAPRLREARVTLVDGRHVALDAAALGDVVREASVARGDVRAPEAEPLQGRLLLFPWQSSGAGEEVRFSVNLWGQQLERLRGVQVSLVSGVVTGEMRGAQFALVSNRAGAAHGLQAAVATNTAAAGSHALQAAVGANFANDDFHGGQLSVGVNWASGSVTGAQLATGLNVAGELHGVQLSSGLNVAGDTFGVQLGLVNIAREVHGLQVGLVNISEDAAAPIGLVNLVAKGQHDAQVFATAAGPGAVFKLGGRALYTALEVTSWRGASAQDVAALAGLGVELGRGRFFLDLEALGGGRLGAVSGTPAGVLQGRVVAGLKLFRYLAPFAGLTVNGDLGYRDPMLSRTRLSGTSSGVWASWFPGWVLGLQL